MSGMKNVLFSGDWAVGLAEGLAAHS